MTLHARWFGEGRKAQHPPDPRYPLGMVLDGTQGRPGCEAKLEYPAPCIGKWMIICDVCGMSALVTAAGRPDDPHTIRLPCITVWSA